MAALASLAFVAAPATSPTVTMNLMQTGSSGNVTVKADGFSLGAPQFEGDPNSVGASYGERTVEFALQVAGTYEEAATLVQSVMRQLTQGAAGFGLRNWLMFRWAGSQPFFLRTFRSSLSPMDWRQSGAGVWEVPVEVVCDGFVYGAPEDVGSFVITVNPSTGTNKIVAGPSILGAVKGDVDTPLVLALTSGLGSSTEMRSGYLASYALGGGLTHTLLARNLTELTSGTDTGATVSAAGTNYIDGDYKQCTFSTSQSLVVRLSGTFSTALTPMPGLYRVLMRVVTLNTAAGGAGVSIKWDYRIGFNGSAGPVQSDASVQDFYNVAGDAHGTLVDFGVMQLPPETSTADGVGFGSAPTAVGAAPSVAIRAGVTALTGSLTNYAVRFDELYLVPADTNYGDGRMAVVGQMQNANVVFDGVADAARPVVDTGAGALAGAPTNGSVPWVGGLPMLRPGMNNYLHWIAESTSTTPATNLTSTFVGRYYPRYVHVRPSAT